MTNDDTASYFLMLFKKKKSDLANNEPYFIAIFITDVLQRHESWYRGSPGRHFGEWDWDRGCVIRSEAELDQSGLLLS